ncbi:protein YLS3-like isoform X3 [Olea europaea var. sylvestris]|uniref:protein YLS3-like isoform X3 n=1 Tax=Olea europaea var. sylvestris TaxID=158386 RepID=UPI000C1D5FE4|nr:protein YLS3-like isoform X3 [Olea europaea var. sylvestris]
MASIVRKISLVLVLVVMLSDDTKAQSGCTTAIVGLSPCLNYVIGNSSTPSSSCCSQLSGVVKSQPQCLCSLLNGGAASSFGITINQTLALALPKVCNVQTPPVSRCNATPVSSPAESPAESVDETPDVPTLPSDSDIPSGTGSKTVPKTDGASVGGSNINTPFNFVGILLFVVLCALSSTGF